MLAARGSAAYKKKLARYWRALAAPPVAAPRVEDVPVSATTLRRREAMHLMRMRVLYWTGLRPQEWQQLPVKQREHILRAVRDYYAEVAEPRSPVGGMFDSIAAIYGGYPWRDWAVDDRGIED